MAPSASAPPAAATVATRPVSARGSRDTSLRSVLAGGLGSASRPQHAGEPSRRENVINAVMWPAESAAEGIDERREVFGPAPGIEVLGEDRSGGFQHAR